MKRSILSLTLRVSLGLRPSLALRALGEIGRTYQKNQKVLFCPRNTQKMRKESRKHFSLFGVFRGRNRYHQKIYSHGKKQFAADHAALGPGFYH